MLHRCVCLASFLLPKRFLFLLREYVLKDYGTGAIMAVPGHDNRDHAFAEKFDLPIMTVVDQNHLDDANIEDKKGVMINSDFINGMKVKDAIREATKQINNRGFGQRQVNYKLRDANFSRQRYWRRTISNLLLRIGRYTDRTR